jgi:CHAT domain-containing protein
MGYSARLLRATAVTALTISTLQLPAFTKAAQEQHQPAPAQSKQVDESANILLEVEGVSEGYRALEDDKLYDPYQLGRQAKQALSISLRNSDLDTFPTSINTQERKTAQNEDFVEQTIRGELSSESNENGGRYINTHTFDAEAEQSISIRVTSDELRTTLVGLFDPDRNLIASSNIGFYGLSAQIAAILPITGQYTIFVSSFEIGETGAYSIDLRSTTAEIVQQPERQAEANRILEQGFRQLSSGQFVESIHSSEAALRIYRELGDRAGEGKALNNLGYAYNELGEPLEALSFLEQAFDISSELSDRILEGTVSINLGNAYFALEEYLKAIEYFEKRLEISRDLKDRDGELKALNNLGSAYESLERYSEAIIFLEQALVIAYELGNLALEGAVLNNLGNCYIELNQYEEAIDYYERRLAVAQELGDRFREGISLSNLGNAYLELNQYEQAISFYQKSVLISQELDDPVRESQTLISMGAASQKLGYYEQAIIFFEQALLLSQKLEDRIDEAAILNSIGLAYHNLDQYEQTIDFYRRSSMIFREVGDQEGEATSLSNLGTAYDELGQYKQAIDVLEQSLNISRELNNRELEAPQLLNLGRVYISIGQYQKAIENFDQSLPTFRKSGDSVGEATALGNLSIAYRKIGEYQQSIAYHEQAIDIFRDLGDRAGEAIQLVNLGNTHLALGQDEQAIQVFESTLAIYRELDDRLEEGKILGNLGSAYLGLGQYEKAIDNSAQSLEIARELGNLNGEVSTLQNLGVIAFVNQQYQDAENFLLAALTTQELQREIGLSDSNKIALFETQQSNYTLLQLALIAQKKYERALEIAEQGRAQAFVDLLSQQLNTGSSTVTSSERQNLEAIKTFSQQQQTTLVEYSLFRFSDIKIDPVLCIWVVSPDGEITFRQVPLTDIDLNSLVTDARDAIGVVRGDRASAQPQLRPDVLAQLQATQDEKLSRLHDLLIEPIADLLPADPNQPVVFIPQGELFLVPFPALKDDNGDYLIENHTILTAPSIQVLQLTHEIANRRLSGVEAESEASLEGITSENGRSLRLRSGNFETENALVVGNPTMPTVTFLTDEGNFVDTQLSSLSGALKEANAVSEFLNAPALTGDRATEATVKQQITSADLIHLATHGLLEYGDPRETGTRDVPGAIALAPGGGDDGLLTSTEILQMDLQADLVVLSACDTGQGRITGDGVIGLSRSFIAAGVPSVVVSLWAVPDAPTAELMTEFYHQLDQGQTKAQALRQAMLTTMQTHPDPRNWAAFTLIGESE